MILIICEVLFIILNMILFIYYKSKDKNYKLIRDNEFILPVSIWITNLYITRLGKNSNTLRKIKRLYICDNYKEMYFIHHCKMNTYVLLVIFGVFALIILSNGKGSTKDTVIKDGKIAIPEYGQTTKEVVVNVDIEGSDNEREVVLDIQANQLSRDEIEDLLDNVEEYVLEKCLGSNESYKKITDSLNFISEYPDDSNVEIYWTFDEEFIDYDGSILYENIAENQDTELAANIYYMDYSRKVTIPISIVIDSNSEDVTVSKLIREISSQNKEYNEKGVIELPSEVNNKKVSYRENFEDEDDRVVLIILGVLAILLILLGNDKKIENDISKKNEEMVIDYPVVINKLALLLSAGMTVRKAWSKICEDYLEEINNLSIQKRFVYEEMVYTNNQILNGEIEIKAYTDFGKRVGLNSYIKLCTLLVQCIQRGNKNIVDNLEIEAIDMSNEHRERLRQYGEKMQLKLMIPMIVLLVISLGVVMVPALLGL